MPFTVPAMPLTCNIYAGPWATRVLRLGDEPCNLAYGKRLGLGENTPDTNEFTVLMQLLLRPGTDVRDLSCHAAQDVIECPAGSGRWYQVCNVDDIGKGFDNEHRAAMLFKISDAIYPTGSYAGLLWPAPIP